MLGTMGNENQLNQNIVNGQFLSICFATDQK